MQPQHHISVKEYLEIDRKADGTQDGVKKYEYHAGEIYAMAGASWAHVVITDNVTAALRSRLNVDRCRTATAEMRVQVGKDYTYPDVVVVCGDPELTDERPPSLQNPQLIVEVLSESTAIRDKGWKMHAYLQIPSVREYWILEQTERLVLQYHRVADEWGLRIFSGKDEVLRSQHLSLDIPIKEFYLGLNL
ncbi:MAG: Uma2 family endonuclease [Rhodothermales bacterium]